MKTPVIRSAAALFAWAAFAVLTLPSSATDFRREVIYQVLTDRFYDGNTANNNPVESPGMYDPLGASNSPSANWRAYFGGDFAGLTAKMQYLADMGVTCLWISPPLNNRNSYYSPDWNNYKPYAPYAGYEMRHLGEIEEHFGDGGSATLPHNGWAAFDTMVAAAHAKGIKIVVDFAPNHSSQFNAAEYGLLYNTTGTLLAASYSADQAGDRIYHADAPITDWNSPYQVQYFPLFGLSDLKQEHPKVDSALKASLTLLASHGVDGFRIDASKHVNWGWMYSMANSIYTNAPAAAGNSSFLFGEWVADSTSDPMYWDYKKFTNKSGVTGLDFPLRQMIEDVFGTGVKSFYDLDALVNSYPGDYDWEGDLVTFIDNHDRPRFLTVNPSQAKLHAAMVFLLAGRGIPCLYYGTEQYLYNNTSGGGDPYNRPMMTSFSTTTTAYKIVQKLSALRRGANSALAYGTLQQRWLNNNVYVFERKFGADVVLVAINKGAGTVAANNLVTALPAGTYPDYLGLLNGQTLVTADNGGGTSKGNVNLPPDSVSVWTYSATETTPFFGSLSPVAAQAGVKVSVAGAGFGSTAGTLQFLSGTTTTNVAAASWSDSLITFNVPAVANGAWDLKVIRSGGASATLSGQTFNKFTVYQAALVPVTFSVNWTPGSNPNEKIYLTGDTSELGAWSANSYGAVGPFLRDPANPNHWFLTVSVPVGKTINFKFLRGDPATGILTYEGGSNRSYFVPTTAPGANQERFYDGNNFQ
ncbi:MAG: alpha-amylase [Opitutus sp.]|nr:alpha-amylase [Opitutus sp.]